MANRHFRLGELLRAPDGFEGTVVQPVPGTTYEYFQTANQPLAVSTLFRAETGGLRRYSREQLTPAPER